MKTQILAAAFAILASGVGAAQSPAPAPAASPDYTITASSLHRARWPVFVGRPDAPAR